MTGFELDSDRIEVVKHFNFLFSFINKKANSSDEILRRIALGSFTIKTLGKVFKCKEIRPNTKIRLAHALIFSLINYSCESWTLRKRDRKKINLCEVSCWRRILCMMPWTARRTNRSILEEIKPAMSLEAQIKFQLSYFCHSVRRARLLEKEIMFGEFEGTRQ